MIKKAILTILYVLVISKTFGLIEVVKADTLTSQTADFVQIQNNEARIDSFLKENCKKKIISKSKCLKARLAKAEFDKNRINFKSN